VRRWLTALVEEGLVERLGRGRGTKYRAITSEDRHNETVFTANSQSILAYINKPLYEREPTAYDKNWLAKYEPNVTFYLREQDRAPLHNQGLVEPEAQAGTYVRKIYNRLLIDLSYHSSRLEGNTYSLLDTKKLITEGKLAEGKLDEEAVMILNGVVA